MHGQKRGAAVCQGEWTAAFPRHGDRTVQHGASGAATQKHDQCGVDRGPLGVQPKAADIDLLRRWRLVDAPAASRGEFEVLYGVRDVDAAAVDPGLLQRLIEQLTGGT